MIIRIVKMTFQADQVEAFKAFFDPYKKQIRNFPGCSYLQILQDKDHPQLIFSYSHWNDGVALDTYRHSELFKKIWPQTKALFAAKPEAWSTELLHDLP